MKITPLDIRRKEFKRSVRGYSDEEVDIFLDEVADEFERLFQENMDMQERVQRLQEQAAGYAQVKEALEKTLITAQIQSEEMKTNANKERELILRDAEYKAREMINESYGETQRVQQTLVQLKLLEEDFRFKFRSLLEGYLKLLQEAPLSAATAEAAEGAPTQTVPRDAEKTAAAPPPAPAAGRSAAPPVPAPEGSTGPTAPVGPTAAPAVAPPVAPSASPAAAAVRADEGPGFGTEDDEDLPTQESESLAGHMEAVGVDSFAAPSSPRAGGESVGEASDEEVTAETNRPSHLLSLDGQEESDGVVHGFFFGRQIDDFDVTFPPDDETKKDKARDFEW